MQQYLQKYNINNLKSNEDLKQELKKITELKKIYKSERSEKIAEIYENYLYWNTKSNIEAFKKMYPDTKQQTLINKEKFKKTKSYYPPIPVSRLCIKLSHLKKISDLDYLISEARDMKNRNQNFNKWLFFSIKKPKDDINEQQLKK